MRVVAAAAVERASRSQRILRGLRFDAEGMAAPRQARKDMWFAADFHVAVEAELCFRLAAKRRVIRGVRVVASHAGARLHGGVRKAPLERFALMAFVAGRCRGLRRALVRHDRGVDARMAGGAASLQGRVDVLLPCVLRMAALAGGVLCVCLKRERSGEKQCGRTHG